MHLLRDIAVAVMLLVLNEKNSLLGVRVVWVRAVSGVPKSKKNHRSLTSTTTARRSPEHCAGIVSHASLDQAYARHS